MLTPASETRLTDASPTTKLVYKVVEYNGCVTQQQIIEESQLDGREVQTALRDLVSWGIVEKHSTVDETSWWRYRLSTAAEEPERRFGGRRVDETHR